MSKLIEEFTASLANSKKVRGSSVVSYHRDLELFYDRLGLTDEDCIKMNTGQLQAYLDGLAAEGKSGPTVLRSATSLRNFFAFLVDKGSCGENPALGVKLPKKESKPPVVLSSAQIDLLMSLPNTDEPKGVRDKAMLELLYATGMKVSELITLELRDVDLAHASVVCRKEDHQRVIPMGAAAEKAVREYILNVRDKMVASKKIKTLFVSCQGKPMTRQGFWKLIKTYIEEAGIKMDVTPQTLRHSFAVHLLQNGADMKDVSQMLGYSDRGSTGIYRRMVDEKIKKTYNRTHPRA